MNLNSLQSLLNRTIEFKKQHQHITTLQTGEFLFRQGETARYIFGILSGQIHLFRDLPDGHSITLHTARENETFAEAALFSNQYHCYARVTQDSKVICIDSKAFRALLEQDNALCLDYMAVLAGQIRDLRSHLSLRDIRSAEERLLTWLKNQVAIKGGAKEPNLILIDRTWTSIADELGLSREVVYRSLKKLEDSGKLKRNHNRVSLL